MAFIPYVSQEDASPELRELYERYREPDGEIDNILRIRCEQIILPAEFLTQRPLFSFECNTLGADGRTGRRTGPFYRARVPVGASFEKAL